MQILKKVYSKQGNKIVLTENFQNRPQGGKTVLIIGVFHGDEGQGKFLIENFITTKLPQMKLKNRLLFIPCLNPDGLFVNTRGNSNGVDLNRNFATKNFEVCYDKTSEFYGGEIPASEIETQFMQEVIEEYRPDLILTLHAPFCVVNYDGNAEEIAEKISKIINYPVQADIGYPTKGSFGTYCGIERNIPTITLELDENVDVFSLISPMEEIFEFLANY